MEMLRKLSTKTIMGKLEKPETGTEIFLYRVWGMATRFKSMETDKGISIGLIGRFRAKRSDGKEFEAGTLWLPLFLAESISGTLASDSVNEVQFAYDCYVAGVEPEESPIGYMYYFRPVLEPEKENDPLSLMEQSFTKALPAPETDKKKAKK
jgi:hypothetical protein